MILQCLICNRTITDNNNPTYSTAVSKMYSKAQSAGAVKYIDCISAEGKNNTQRVFWI